MMHITLFCISVWLWPSVTAVGVEPKYIRSEAVQDTASLVEAEEAYQQDSAVVGAKGNVEKQKAKQDHPAKMNSKENRKIKKLLLPKIGMVSWFRNEDASPSWKSKVGGFVSNCTEDAALARQKEGGFNSVQQVLTGSPGTKCSFGHIIPEVFTVCSATRYTTNQNQNRILQGEPGVWLHGHYMGKTFVANYGDYWLTKLQKSEEDLLPGSGIQDPKDWVIMCGTNSHAKDGSRLVRGLDEGLEGKTVKSFFTRMFSRKGPVGGGVRLNIGDDRGHVASNSDWALFEVMSWDRVLEPDEMDTVIAYLKTKLERPAPEPKKQNTAKKFTGLYRYGHAKKSHFDK